MKLVVLLYHTGNKCSVEFIRDQIPGLEERGLMKGKTFIVLGTQIDSPFYNDHERTVSQQTLEKHFGSYFNKDLWMETSALNGYEIFLSFVEIVERM